MFSGSTSLALNSTVSALGSSSNKGHSARGYSFPTSLPLTDLLPPLTSPTPASDSQPLPDFRSTPSSFPSTMPSAASGLALPTSVEIPVGPQSQSIPSSSGSSDNPSTDATTRTGRSIHQYLTLTSNSVLSASASPPTISGISTALSLTTLSLPQIVPSAMTSQSMLPFAFIFTSVSILPLPTHSSTQSFSPLPRSSISSQDPPFPSSRPPSTSSALSSTPSSAAETSTTFVPTTVYTTVALSSTPSRSPPTSTYTITSVLVGNGGTVTDFVTSSGVLSTETPSTMGSSHIQTSPGTIVGIVLGIVGALAFAALWLLCARRRHRKLVHEAALIQPQNHAPVPLGDEVPDVEELGYGSGHIYGARGTTTRSSPPIEERYAGILAALHSTEGFGMGHAEGSTGGVYGSHHDGATDGDDDIARTSSPTLPIYSIPPDDLHYAFALSPPPPVPSPSQRQAAQPAPPPSAYFISRRTSSPDAAAWLGGYSVAPSCNSHYARSQTLGSGSGSGSVDALTRTRTGSEEPLLSIRKPSVELSQGVPSSGGISPTLPTDPGGNRPGLGSAFGSPEGSMYSPSAIPAVLHRDFSGSYDAWSTYGSGGSYGPTRSGTPSSFDVLRSVSSQGALSSAYSHGHGPNQGFRFGFSRPGSESSGSTGKKRGSGRHSFGVPPTSFRAWKEWGTATSDKEKQAEKQSVRERDWRRRAGSATSASSSGSMEKSSPVLGVRALLDRLRRASHTPSPRSSDRELPSPTLRESTDVDPEKATAKMSVERVTPPPPPIHVQAATPQHRRQYSFILSNPDPRPPSPYSGTGDVAHSTDVPPPQDTLPNPHDIIAPQPRDSTPLVSPSTGEIHAGMTLPVRFPLTSAPSPAPTEESRLVEGLLHPRLRTEGRSDASLMDFEDYSRPISGVVKNRMYSTTTFGTQDDTEITSPSGGTPVQELQEAEEGDDPVDVFGASTTRTPRESWFVDDAHLAIGSARNSPVVI